MASTTTPVPAPVAPVVQPSPDSGSNYKGFVAGVFSGVTKLTVGHPFDTVKLNGLPSAPPRPRLQQPSPRLTQPRPALRPRPLPAWGQGIAGILAGATVSTVAAPVEHIKARLQVQYAASKADRLYSGPLDAIRKIYSAHGIRGLYRGFGATLLFRSFFFFWWGSYDIFSRLISENTNLSAPAVNFWAGGLSAQVFWITSYPSDVVKQRIMTDPLGGKLGDGERRFRKWSEAARAVYREGGARGYWRGFLPCFLRAFPANAMALVAFEGVMRHLP